MDNDLSLRVERLEERLSLTEESAGWHWDKKVPIAIIGVGVAQVVAVVWIFSSLSFASADHDRRLLVLENRSLERTAEFAQINERLARIEQQLVDLITNTTRQHSEGSTIKGAG